MSHARNCDTLELIDRINMAGQIEDVLNRNPHLRKANRLTVRSDDYKSKETEDYSATRDWIGDLKTELLNLKLIWKIGKERAQENLKKFNYSVEEIDTNSFDSSISMKCPFGVVLTQETTEENTQLVNQEDIQVGDDLAGFEGGEELHDYLNAEGTYNSHVVNESGESQHKSNAINSFLNNKTKSSSDRIIRVQNLQVSEPSLIAFEEERTFKVTDTLLSLARFKRGGIGTVLIGVDQIYFNKEYVWSLTDDQLKLSKLTGKVLKFVEDGSKLLWTGEYGETVVVEGSSSLAFSTKINDELDMFVDQENLEEAKGLLETIFNSSSPIVPIISYPNSLNIDCFNITLPSLVDSKTKERCLVAGCNKFIKLDFMRLHVGAHVVRGETKGQVCGFCGVMCNSPVSIVFSSGSGVSRTYKAFSGCKYFSDFSMKSSTNFLKGNPCTNRPVNCEACANDSVFWSFNLLEHYKDRHSFLECPIKMCESEKSIMLKDKYLF